MPAGR